MINKFKSLSYFFVIALLIAGFALVTTRPVMAEITNPAIGGQLGSNADNAKKGIPFAIYFVTLWRGVITVGGLLVFIFFLWGAIEWITAGGDSGKITKARDRLTQSFIGFVILISTGIILAFIGKVFLGDSFNFFQLSIPTTSTTPALNSINSANTSVPAAANNVGQNLGGALKSLFGN